MKRTSEKSVQLVSPQITVEWWAVRPGCWHFTRRPARSRARVPIRRLQATEGGQCRIKESHADQRLEMAESCVAVAFFVSPAQECSESDGSGGSGPANGQSGRKGRKGHCNGGTARERGKRLDEALGEKRREQENEEAAEWASKACQTTALSSRRQT